MGGTVFAQEPHPLKTPRMPTQIYHVMNERCKAALRRLYHCVACPVEAPGKKDYGDLDIFVAWAVNPIQDMRDRPSAIQMALGAEFVKVNGGISHFAIPWPADLTRESNATTKPREYIQVDVTVAKSLEDMQWMLFKHAHGDIWSLLGSMIRPYGLTIDEKCLSIRVPEMEATNRKHARIPLTAEPAEVLNFLGLPGDKFWEESFPSIDEMFEYLTQCRMFHVKPAREKDAVDREQDMGQDGLRSDDRRRMKTRPVYRQWMDTFLPQCRLDNRFLEARTSRDEIRQEAFAKFQIQDEYRHRLDQHISKQQILHIKQHIIKAAFPVPDAGSTSPQALQYRGCLVKALVKIILEEDVAYGVVPDPEFPLKDDRGVFNLENIQRFITMSHKSIGAAAMALHHQGWLEKKRASPSSSGAK